MSFILPGRSFSLAGRTNVKIHRFKLNKTLNLFSGAGRPVDELRGECVLPKGEIKLNR